ERLGNFLHREVANQSVLHKPAARSRRLEANSISSAQAAIMIDHYFANAARSFTAKGNYAAAMTCGIVFDKHVLRGPVDAQAIRVAAGLQTNVVIIII